MRKPRKNQPQTPDEVQGRDLFQTPNYATDLLIPFIPKNITHIWECAAGEGKISNRLMHYNYNVFSTDIRKCPEIDKKMNFIQDTAKVMPGDKAWWSTNLTIITNPPFSLDRKFFKKCIEYDIPFALLIRSDYCQWRIDAVRKYGCEKIIPYQRIDFITPTGLSGKTGNISYFHTMWLTRYFNIGRTETFVDLTDEMKQNI